MLWWGGIKRKEKAGDDIAQTGMVDPMGSTPVTGDIEVGKHRSVTSMLKKCTFTYQYSTPFPALKDLSCGDRFLTLHHIMR